MSEIRLKILRQERPGSKPYWEEFILPYRKSMNVIVALLDIQKNPMTKDGKKTTPVTWESSCLEEICGACTMNVNGRVRQACTALIDTLSQPIVLEPAKKFPVVRDLVVDRSRLFQNFKKVKAWIPIDGTHNLGPGPRLSDSEQRHAYLLSRCIACGCCLEVCPQVNEHSDFIGAAVINQVALFNRHPTGRMNREERLEAVMKKGGIADCGNSQNCVEVCPKEIPLTTSIAEVNRQTTVYGVFGFLKK